MCGPWSEATEGVWGTLSPINMKVPLGTKRDEGEGAEAVERSDRKGLGNAFPNETEGAVRAQKEMRVKTLISFCAHWHLHGGWGNRRLIILRNIDCSGRPRGYPGKSQERGEP